ncbi:MAG: DNA mismatch repair protein [Bacteroidales bacterium]|jgi:DNA mismatch repair ATPase MutS|nr:DNA mismatch repair protein [Bacteroidales bacterium]
MTFKTDNQTLNDLGIFSRSADESVYAIFNRCRTQGGASILEDMFRTPLADLDRINNRATCIKFFQDLPMDFPYNTELFSPSESYLSDADPRSQLAMEDNTLQRKVNAIIGSDTEFSKIHGGILAVISLVNSTQVFLKNIQSKPNASSISETFQTLPSEILEAAAKHKNAKKISYAQCVELDRLFRFTFRDDLLRLQQAIYYVDVYYSVAEVAILRGFVFAKALPADDNILMLKGVHHPRLKNAIGNDITITADNNMVFLTGANMAGKSTIMKSLSIALYTAQVGFPVAADAMEFSIRSGMFTTINLPDNINAGYSHFYSEVMRLKMVAQQVRQDNNLFIIFDELFRGTNVKDAYDATIAVIEAFSAIRKCTFIVSTHIIEAGEVLKDKCKNIQFVYMPTVMENGVPRYTYRLTQGITEDRHGMVIINNEGIVELFANAR